jgi:type II restriction enzyme
VGESKHQGNDVEKIEAGVKQGKFKDQDFMAAGNAIERVHKNISEFRNYMLNEKYFPYVVFFQGSNFATETIILNAPNGRKVKLTHNAGDLNRIDRVTASNYGMKINKNYCRNITITKRSEAQMLQIPSLFFQCNLWGLKQMAEVMWDIAVTSIEILDSEL